MKLEINIKGGFNNVTPQYDHAKRTMVREGTFSLVRFLQQSPPTPVDHGHLRKFYIESLSDTTGVVKSPANYALYQDQGTRAHDIYPKNKKYLYWKGAQHPVKHVHHPGFAGKHFVEKSFIKLKPLLKQYFMRALHES